MKLHLAVILLLVLALVAPGAITAGGSASTPADNGTSTTTPQEVTPPTTNTGDLVLMIAFTRTTSATIGIGATGGQTWDEGMTTISNTNISAKLFWCRFNGTWTINPSIQCVGGNACSVVMLTFVPSVSTNSWALDGSQVELDFTAPSTPFTVTVTGRTTGQASTVTVAGWFTADDNSWTNIAGTGWVVSGGAQYRNLAGLDMSGTFAHRIQTSTGATNNVSKDQTVITGDAGTTLLVTFYEFDPGSAPAVRRLLTLGVGE